MGLTEIIVLSVLVIMIIAAIVLSRRNKVENIEEQYSSPEPANVNAIESKTDDGELIAVLTAAIMAFNVNQAGTTLRVKSFRKIGDNAPVWNRVSRAKKI